MSLNPVQNFNFDSVQKFIWNYIKSKKRDELRNILEQQNIKHFLKPAVTSVKTLKMVIATGDEELTMLMLKAMFDLNLKLEDDTFIIVINKTLDYIKEGGFVKALEYIIKRYTPLQDENVKRNLRKTTMENSKKMLKTKPVIERYKKEKEKSLQEDEIKRMIDEERVFKEKQRYRGVIDNNPRFEPQEWSNSKDRWSYNNQTPSNEPLNKPTGSIISEKIDTIIRLSDKKYEKRAIDDAVNNLKEAVKKKMGEFKTSTEINETSTENKLITDILDLKNKGYRLGNSQVSTKLKYLGNHYNNHKDFKREFSDGSPFPDGYFRTDSKFNKICGRIENKIYK